MAMVGIILLTLANLANLLLARAATREREIRSRLSIGASRAFGSQLLVECLLLSFCGTILGGSIAYWLSSILPRWASEGNAPIPLNLTPDSQVLLFSTAVAVLTGIIFGLAPALQGARVEPMHALKSSGRAASGSGARWSTKQTLVRRWHLRLFTLSGGVVRKNSAQFYESRPGFARSSPTVEVHILLPIRSHNWHLSREMIEKLGNSGAVSRIASCNLAVGWDTSDIFCREFPYKRRDQVRRSGSLARNSLLRPTSH
jgi:hypothetical protein